MDKSQRGAARFETVSADDLDRQEIEQLHAATLKASDSCFELKKLCAVVLVPGATLVSVFTDRRLDSSIFVAGALIVTLFWAADAVGYYYQRRLRVRMRMYVVRRALRCEEPYQVATVPPVNWVGALFNGSMTYYALLYALVSVIWLGYVLKWFA